MAKRRESGAVAGPRTVSYRIVGESALYYSRPFPPDAKRAVDEGHDAFDERMWRERCHWESDDPQARAVVSGAQLKRSFTAAAKFRGEKIPGMGAKTWVKRFGAGILVTSDFVLDPHTTRATVQGRAVFVPSDGKVGSTSGRVWRRFPLFAQWSADVKVVVLDGLIDADTFERHAQTAGAFDGLGSFRPGSPSPNVYGRYSVSGFQWADM